MGYVQREILLRYFPTKVQFELRKVYDEAVPLAKGVIKNSVQQYSIEEFEKLCEAKKEEKIKVQSSTGTTTEVISTCDSEVIVGKIFEPANHATKSEPVVPVTKKIRQPKRPRTIPEDSKSSGYPVSIPRCFEIPACNAM